MLEIGFKKQADGRDSTYSWWKDFSILAVVKQQNKATNQQMIILIHETNIERQNYLAKFRTLYMTMNMPSITFLDALICRRDLVWYEIKSMKYK